MIYVVLGMHKSGTTLVSRILHESGINMIDTADPRLSYDAGNQYERRSTFDLNNDILSSHTKLSFDTIPRRPISVTAGQRQRMREIIDDCQSRYSDWGFKDPRTCLTYSAWAPELPPHMLVLIFRDYIEVLGHYHVTGWKQVRLLKLRKVLHTWGYYNRRIIDYVRRTDNPSIFLNYEALMTDTNEFERFSRFVGRSLTDVRDSRQYRSRSNKYHRIPLGARLVAATISDNPSLILNELQLLHSSN